MADISTDEELSMQQYNAISALLHEPTIRKASAVCGVPERTLYHWLKDASFDAAYREARRAAVGQALARVQHASSDAVAVIRSIMNDTKKAPMIRLLAASRVLSLAVRAIEIEDLQARVAALEAAHAKGH